MTKERDNRVSCGLCNKYVDGDWEEHEQSEEHQQKLKNLGGINAMTQRRVATSEMVSGDPNMVKIAEKLADSVDTKMENILTGKKGYNIHDFDDLKKEDGFITPAGDWYSCDPVYHNAFAIDYVEMVGIQIKKNDTAKDYLVDIRGWLSVTVGLTDIYMQSSKKGITYAQKKTLKRWLKKFKHPFHINRVLVDDEFHDFFSDNR